MGSAPECVAAPPLTQSDLEGVRRAARLARTVLDEAARAAQPGVRTQAIDEVARDLIERAGAVPIFLGYLQGDSPPFPAAACVSVNDEVVHGIPGARTLAPGDLISIDVGLALDGWCADMSTSRVMPGGPASREAEAQRAIEAARALIECAAQAARDGVRWSSIARRMEAECGLRGVGYVREYVGHGVGRLLHEPPRVPAYWTGFAGDDFVLRAGMVLAIEPIVTIGGSSAPGCATRVRRRPDGWTIETCCGALAVHEERMVIVGAERMEIL